MNTYYMTEEGLNTKLLRGVALYMGRVELKQHRKEASKRGDMQKQESSF